MKKYLLCLLLTPFYLIGQVSNMNEPQIYSTHAINNVLENDIVITEIMFDPTPIVDLPDAEYVEIYNNSVNDIQLENWKLYVGSKKYTLQNTILESGKYLLLTKDASLFPDVNTLEVKITSLTNSGTVLKLESDQGSLINQIHYSTNLFKDDSKKDGGWSLEIINPNNYCLGSKNWKGSTSNYGGTPGLINSVADFNYFPSTSNFISKVTLSEDADLVSLYFNGFVDESSISLETNYSQTYTVIYENNPDGSSSVKLNLETSLDNEPNFFVFNDLLSCDGTEIITDTVWVSKFENIEKGDIIVNEVMFNPRDGSSEFVEIYNKTDKFLSLRNVYLSNFTTENDESIKDGEKRISDSNIVFPPRNYFVVTKNAESVINEYTTSSRVNFIEISSLPKLNNDEGNVAILDAGFNFVDKMVYSSDMHVGLISTEKQRGVSLERIKSDNSSLDFNNWTSASQSSGGATPGLPNSVSPVEYESKEIFEVFPEVFSPNNDGRLDVVELKYNLSEIGIVANVKVFNSNGVFIKEISNNELLGSTGSFIWNGMNEENYICEKGIYVFWVELFDSKGNVRVYKKVCVLG